MRQRITILAGIAISIALLFFALRDVSLSDLLGHLGEADFLLLGAATVAATGTFAIRALRWRLLLLPTKVAFGPRFATVCIGFMANNLLPARIGEFARAYSLSRTESIGVSTALGSLVVERLLDALVLTTLVVPAYFLGVTGVAESEVLRKGFTGLVLLVGVGVVTTGLLVRFPGFVLRHAERWARRTAPERVADRLLGILRAFITGLGALKSGSVLLKALAWSVVVWVWNSFSFYLGFLAFDMHEPGLDGAMLLQAIIGVAVAIPSSPGFFGPFEAAARVGLGLYDIAPARIISFAAGYHILTFIPVTVLGIWYMHRLGISREEFGQARKTAGDGTRT